ncbi:MAG: baseplate J/gp47 family protein [Patescibacteria group bacterium]
MTDLRQAHVQRVYRPLSIVFVALVLLIAAGAAYAGWSSTVISITPLLKPVTATFPVAVGPTISAADSNQLVGTVNTAERSAAVTVQPPPAGPSVPAHATGAMTFRNITAKSQPLAVGTRLRAENGVIVRTTARVDVPANGSIDAPVVADPLGNEGNLPAGRFVIVALWPGLQDKIYGQTAQPLSGGMASGGSMLSLDELTAASNQAEQQIRDVVGGSQPGIFVTLKPVAVVSDPKPAVPSASYTVTVTAAVTTVTYPADRLNDLLRQELRRTLSDGQDVASLTPPSLTVQDRPSSDRVVLEVAGRGLATLSTTNPLLTAAAYTGLSAADIKSKLLGSSLVKSATVKLAPWWRTTAPDQPERISISVAPAQE